MAIPLYNVFHFHKEKKAECFKVPQNSNKFAKKKSNCVGKGLATPSAFAFAARQRDWIACTVFNRGGHIKHISSPHLPFCGMPKKTRTRFWCGRGLTVAAEGTRLHRIANCKWQVLFCEEGSKTGNEQKMCVTCLRSCFVKAGFYLLITSMEGIRCSCILYRLRQYRREGFSF